MTRAEVEAGWTNGNDSFHRIAALTGVNVSVIIQIEREVWTMKEVMRMTGITENALRYYKSKEVLAPTVQENSGRRQWLYDDSAVEKLKRLALLKFIRVPINEAGKALEDEGVFREMVTSTLEELKKERERINMKIFVAETLAVSSGEYLVSTDEADAVQTKILNEVIREVINSNAKKD